MKYVLARIAICVLVICVTPLWVLLVLNALEGGYGGLDFIDSSFGGMVSSAYALGGLSLCSWLVGAIAAAVWKKRFC
ncbi:MAG TPA: hypothetical protein VMY69_03030, partial [Phycisphaerae bacterium]|nr:hypothetical protein [Phycisphaerae bacterium]